ncbi:N-terminal acetyltransferase [Aspergillus hancockii]|nr:N-terminal acetyltransferase [Aspergillus hancockii]
MASQPPTYNPDQLELYLERIGYADSISATGTTRLSHAQQSIQHEPLATLTELQRRHLGAIPWGNSALHYSQHRTISIHPSALFEKLVMRRLDGYCMENTNLLYVVLRSLGYDVHPTGGRVSHAVAGGSQTPGSELYMGLGHMILLVTIDGQKYNVDVGFGNFSPTSPLPLKENAMAVCMAPAEMRLVKDTPIEFIDRSQKLWIYQVRHSPEKDWIPHYSFSELEFLPQDFAMMNYSTSHRPSSWFVQTLVCTRVILDEGTTPIGIYVLSRNEVKKRLRGETEVVETLAKDEDRVKALAKWFGMHFHEYEVEGIRGLASELK